MGNAVHLNESRSELKSGVAIEFDPAKDAINREKHGVSLAFGARLFHDPRHFVLLTERIEDGEQRIKLFGRVDGRLWIAVYVIRNGAIRFISVRRSNDGEGRIYDRTAGRSQ